MDRTLNWYKMPVGMQLANEILGGEYEFVLTTHVDKGHIHNHLLWNAVKRSIT